jgi:hypothetical protein
MAAGIDPTIRLWKERQTPVCCVEWKMYVVVDLRMDLPPSPILRCLRKSLARCRSKCPLNGRSPPNLTFHQSNWSRLNQSPGSMVVAQIKRLLTHPRTNPLVQPAMIRSKRSLLKRCNNTKFSFWSLCGKVDTEKYNDL